MFSTALSNIGAVKLAKLVNREKYLREIAEREGGTYL